MITASVCIPVYNPSTFLEPAIESVLSQSFTDFELLVIDDHSVQPVEPIVSRFRDRRLRFVQNECNLGLVGNWNRSISLAEGRYITLFHQDDLMHPDNLRHKIEALDGYPDAGFVYSNIRRINAQGDVVGNHWLPQPTSDAVLSGSQIFGMIASSGNPISCPSVMTRKECYQRFGLFDPRLPFAVDLEMWMRIAVHYNVIYLADPLIYQRVHPEQETARFQGTGRDYQDVLKALDIVRSRPLPPDFRVSIARAYRTLSNHAYEMARWKLRQAEILNSVRYSVVAVTSVQRSITTSFE